MAGAIELILDGYVRLNDRNGSRGGADQPSITASANIIDEHNEDPRGWT
jgi:hypothetical protein